MPVTTEPYNQAKIDSIANLLAVNSEQGIPTDFEIFVDTLKVIPRTSNYERFDTYGDFVNAETKSVTIVLFNGQSNRNDKYIFRLKKEDAQEGLNGFDVDHKISEKLTAERKKWEFEQLQEKYDAQGKELKEANQYIDELEDMLEKSKNRKFHLGNVNLGELGSVMLEGFVRRNPQLLAKVPGGEALAGILEEDNADKANGLPLSTIQQEAEVTIRKSTQPAASAEDQHYIDFIRQLKQAFDKEEFVQVMSILEHLSKDKALIDETLSFITDQNTEEDDELSI
jgi:hypothetical protein